MIMDWDEICNHYRRPSIDASYQVTVHLDEGFQRRRLKCEKLTDDRRRTPRDGKSSHCLWQGELINYMQYSYCSVKKQIMTTLDNQGVQTTRKDNKII